ncbi:MAG: hypothetical protein ACYTAN_12705 [Planctomycetota bacterium]|jgi:hypothetical protein
MAKKKSRKIRKAKRKVSLRAERRASVLKLVDQLKGEDKAGQNMLQMAHQAMLLVEEEDTERRRQKWTDRLKAAVTPALEDILASGSKGEKLQASHVVARLVDSTGEHQVKGKRFEYGAMVVDTLGDLGVGKLQAQVDTGGDEITSERWLRVLADLQPVFKEAIERQVREALKAAKK